VHYVYQCASIVNSLTVILRTLTAKEESMIDPAQIRMARAALGLGVRDLAAMIEAAPSTLTRFETNKGGLQSGTMSKIKTALEGRGVIFLDDDGRGSGVRVTAGQSY
jgi:ribosome-binding protein aMBF1 (putative translation factor)